MTIRVIDRHRGQGNSGYITRLTFGEDFKSTDPLQDPFDGGFADGRTVFARPSTDIH